LKLSASLTRIPLRALRTSAQAEAARIQAKRRQDQAKQPPLSDEEAEEAAKKRQEEKDAAVESILNRAHETVTLRAQNNLDGDLSYVTAFGEAGSLFVRASGV